MVPARLDLDLDAPVALGEFGGHALDERVGGRLDADRHAGRDGSRLRAKHLAERTAFEPRVEIPDGHLERGLGHAVSAHARPAAEDLARMAERSAEHRTARARSIRRTRRSRWSLRCRRDRRRRRTRPSRSRRRRRRRRARTRARRSGRSSSRTAGRAAAARRTAGRPRSASRRWYCAEAGGQSAGCDRTPHFAQHQAPRRSTQHSSTLYFPRVDFRYLAIEGPIGLGKTALAERLGARLDATVVLDERDNPFLADFYAGRDGAAFQAQLFFTLARHRQQLAAAPGRPVQPDDDLRLPLRARPHLRVHEPRRQRAVHLSAALRAGLARRARRPTW